MSQTTRASYSSLKLHRECPQAWAYRYIRRLSEPPGKPKPAMEFGSFWHAIMAADSLERGRSLNSLKYVPKEVRTVEEGPTFAGSTVTVQEVLEGVERWWAKTLDDDQRAEWLETGGDLTPQERLRKIYANWTTRWAEDRSHEEPLAVELYWERALGDTGLILFGFIDEVYLDARRGMVVIRDHKTGSTLGSTSGLDDMMDSQLQLYGWGAAPTVDSWEVGAQIRAVAYDRVRSVAPKPPHLTASGRLAVRGGEPSISQTDLATYVEWAKGPDGEGVPWGEEGAYYVSGKRKGEPKFGRYVAEESVIETLSSKTSQNQWQQRALTPLNVNLVRSHLRAAVDSAKSIEGTQTAYAEVGEVARILTRSICRWCPFADMCRAEMFGGPGGEYPPEDYGLVVRP